MQGCNTKWTSFIETVSRTYPIIATHKIGGENVCRSVCPFVCLSVCLLAHKEGVTAGIIPKFGQPNNGHNRLRYQYWSTLSISLQIKHFGVGNAGIQHVVNKPHRSRFEGPTLSHLIISTHTIRSKGVCLSVRPSAIRLNVTLRRG